MSRALRSTWLVLVATSLAGCGSGHPERAPVHGRVTVEGQPVTAGKVIFYPETGRPAIGEIQADGTYWLTTFEKEDGAVLGKHAVTIKATRVTGPGAPTSFEEELAQARDKSNRDAAGGVEWLVPEEYARRETSTLEREVVRGDNEIDFEL